MIQGYVPPPPSEGVLVGEDRNSESKREMRLARMLEVEDTIMQNAAGIIHAILAAQEICPEQPEPPPHWISEYGEAAAKQRLEVARQGWKPASEMTTMVKVAQQTYVGISKARGHKMSLRAHNLNVQIQLPAPTSADHPGGTEYPSVELEG